MKLALWPRTILETVPCALKKNVYSAAFRWNAPSKYQFSLSCLMCHLYFLIDVLSR